jgi:hypothetical protein
LSMKARPNVSPTAPTPHTPYLICAEQHIMGQVNIGAVLQHRGKQQCTSKSSSWMLKAHNAA